MGRMTGNSKSKPAGRQRQTRLEELLTPLRRSTRRRSGTLGKQEIMEVVTKSKPDLKRKIDTTILEVEPSTNQHITLLASKGSRKSFQSEDDKSKSRGPETVVLKQMKLNEVDQRELLKKFDLNPLYGPCRGISRRERYVRAIKYELKPVPDDIIQILDENTEDSTFQNWYVILSKIEIHN